MVCIGEIVEKNRELVEKSYRKNVSLGYVNFSVNNEKMRFL